MCTVSYGVKSVSMLICVIKKKGSVRSRMWGEGEKVRWKQKQRKDATRERDRNWEVRGIRKQGSEEEAIWLPSWAWTSLQIAAACIFLSLVVMVENCDMAAPGESGVRQKSHRRQRTSVQPVQTHKARQHGCMLAIDWPTSSIHTSHKDPPKQTEFIGAVKRAKLAHPFK